MKKIKTLLIGAGGYGNVYIDFFKEGIAEDAVLAGVVDPFVESAPGLEWIMSENIPLYRSPKEYFANHSVDLTIIAAPIHYHVPYSIIAMEHGSHVLCEKPVTSTVQELDTLAQAAERLDKTVGVGFQWSFSDTMTAVKRDILSGKYGRPKMLKTMVSWPRPLAYYNQSPWKGRVTDKQGRLILDSVVTNATAHYLHNIFFILGDALNEAACPESFNAELYRAKDIESFDTCFLKGKIAGAEFFYAATHATDINDNPRFSYIFEKGIISINEDSKNNIVTGVFADGTVIEYGDPFAHPEQARKLIDTVAHIKSGSGINCTLATARPHLLACNALFEKGSVYNFPAEMLVSSEENIYARGLYQDLQSCYNEAALPSEKGLDWSKEAISVDLQGYNYFNGCGFIKA